MLWTGSKGLPICKKFCITFQTNRTFIVVRAPWRGGFWEKLIQSVKKYLRKLIGRYILIFEQIQTLFVEVEAIVNLPNPLTYVHDDTKVLNTHCLHLISCMGEAVPNIRGNHCANVLR